ncbi:lipopolysaccharide assembly protein LapB [Mangrovimonas sp. YM274]|uniref:tetratricopeptide repeat protein n=1 Tax=Mangrovimonas sp. YM274 TaxID=3070660 RepID=UPI0027DD4FA0|nr:tetratricopeptide repeat protein [Mangrovimonas sp. YM274]WMI67683.1 tetratricopeptide repeat protein [Mangrovimonas sp. YM274]
MKPFCFLLLALILFNCKEQVPKESVLGSVEFTVHGDEQAKPYFEKGLLLLHSFEYVDAREAFKKAQELDPNLAMAYWGEAMTYNHSLWSEQDFEEANAVIAELKQMEHLDELSEIEQDFIEAVEILYTPKTSKNERDVKYRDFMGSLYEKYPGNNEVASFYALSQLGSVVGARNDSIFGQGAVIAKQVLEDNPKHPGALHYLIHSYDDPYHAHLALDAANSYSKVAPDASHALHMPSHIYVALGMWDEVVSSNVASYGASITRKNAKELDNDARGYHSYHWLEYGYLQMDSINKARDMVWDMQKYTNELPSKRARTHMVFLKGTYLCETDDWDNAIVEIPIDVSGLRISIKAMNQFLDGYKAFYDKQPQQLDSLIVDLEEKIQKESLLVDNLSQGAAFCASVTRETPTQRSIDGSTVILTQLKALQAWLNEDVEKTETFLKASVAAQEAMSYSYGPPSIQKPTHELYAEWLVAQKRYEEALQQYELALERGPKRKLVEQGIQKVKMLLGDKVVME